MADTVELILSATVRGFIFGSSGTTGTTRGSWSLQTSFRHILASSFAVQQARGVTVATALADATLVGAGTSNQGVVVVTPTTMTTPYRITGSTAETGIQIGAHVPAVIASTLFNIYTTGGRSFVVQIFSV